MDRMQFRAAFSSGGVAVFPVIHVLDVDQTVGNIAVALEGGCAGVFLINHDFGVEPFLPIIRAARAAFPQAWIGVNFLAVTGKDAFPLLAELERGGTRVDAYWADDARIDERRAGDDQQEAEEILALKKASGWNGLYFGGTAFKKQRDVAPADYGTSAALACGFMDVVTTSGIATGHAADMDKIETFRRECTDTPLALASGITPDNVAHYATHVDAVLVSTGINRRDDFYNIDPLRLADLMQNLHTE